MVMFAFITSLALCAGPTAPAAVPAVEPSKEAARLFDKGRAAFKAGRYPEACPAFEQSFALEPALGTQLNLGACLEKQGKFGSAFAHYTQAAAWAVKKADPEREAYARKAAGTVKPKVSWLAISASEDLDVRVDSQLVHVTPTELMTPIDPGLHALTAEKAGYEKWAANIEVVAPGSIVTQKVPQLKPVVLAALTPASPPAPASDSKIELLPWNPSAATTALSAPPVLSASVTAPARSSATRTAGVTLIVAGAIAASAGALGLGWSFSTYNALQAQKINVLPPDQYSVTRDDYERLKWVYPASWVAAGAGAASVIAGAVLALKKPAALVIAPAAGPSGGAVNVSGTF